VMTSWKILSQWCRSVMRPGDVVWVDIGSIDRLISSYKLFYRSMKIYKLTFN
jgi:hypothetical protein